MVIIFYTFEAALSLLVVSEQFSLSVCVIDSRLDLLIGWSGLNAAPGLVRGKRGAFLKHRFLHREGKAIDSFVCCFGFLSL